MQKFSKFLLPLLVLLVTSLSVYYFLRSRSPAQVIVDSYDTCLQAPGSIIAAAEPGTCVSASGETFTLDLPGSLPIAPPSEITADPVIPGTCEPSFPVVEGGSEPSVSEQYAEECTQRTTEESCLIIDVYNTSSGIFTEPDGQPDCVWQPPT